MIKARKDIAATHKKRTRFQSTPGHFKRIGRNLSIPTEETRRCTFQLSGVLKITEEARVVIKFSTIDDHTEEGDAGAIIEEGGRVAETRTVTTGVPNHPR